ncbi:hypothetical protein ACLOJK_000433 [Asimina triloba]
MKEMSSERPQQTLVESKELSNADEDQIPQTFVTMDHVLGIREAQELLDNVFFTFTEFLNNF